MAASPYCSVADVQALDWARAFGAGSNPGPSQVQTFIYMAAGEIDAILVNKGYLTPVNVASWPGAGALLNGINAKGALAMTEEASPNAPNLDRVQAAWTAAKKMLADQSFVLNADMDVERSEPRGPWSTFQPDGRVYDPMFAHRGTDGISAGCGNPQDPFFSREMRF